MLGSQQMGGIMDLFEGSGQVRNTDSKGQISLTVIRPGVSKNGRYYSPELLKKSAKMFEGAKMFTNHQTEAEHKARPEGNLSDWVATITKVWPESDGTLKALATVIDPAFKKKLEALAANDLLSQMGISIRAIGEASDGEIAGQRCKIVDAFSGVKSVDFVTFAGAGGQVETFESHVPADPNADVERVQRAFGLSLMEARIFCGLEDDLLHKAANDGFTCPDLWAQLMEGLRDR